jgi:putative restriction endonuclease
MTLHCLVTSSEWDSPFFKILANNDTGAASGNQAGFVMPIELRRFFPGLSGPASKGSPPLAYSIEAQLFVEEAYKGTVEAQYQFQTWRGTRTSESRITDNLKPMRDLSSKGDALIIQRSIRRLDCYRLTLIRKTHGEFPTILSLASGRRWGALTADIPLISDQDLDEAKNDEKAIEVKPFSLFDPTAGTTTSIVKKIARSIVFRSSVLEQYSEACAVCGEGLRTPAGLIELDAAHIVPRSLMGADDVRNGFALCKRHHWAFDKGMFGIDDRRKVFVPKTVSVISQNSNLEDLHGHPIREAKDAALRVDPSAFEWHREKLIAR